jgi:hypothetical protein
MKRVTSACLLQILHFVLDPNLEKTLAKEKVKQEVEKYKLDFKDTAKIVKEEYLNDGTIILSVKKMVSGYPIGNYFD